MPAFAKRLDKVTGSAIRALFSLLGDPKIISFGGGNPAKESFPVDLVQKYTDELYKQDGAAILQYGATEGYKPYIKACLDALLKNKGLSGTSANLLALTGSMQGIDLICRTFLDPGDTILVEAPTFLGALQTFNLYQTNIIPVAMDNDGLIMSELEEAIIKHRPKLLYCIPTFQNPTGRTLTLERRKTVAELAAKYDVVVIEDDPYCELRYSGTPLPTIKSFDTTGNVVLLNSFSKTLSPGMRVGYAFGREDIIRKMTICKQSADTHTSNITQAIAAEFLTNNALAPHLESVIPMYSKKLNAMLNAMDKYFPTECTYTKPEGGLFVWGELPYGIRTLDLFKTAVEEYKVAFIPGEHFYPSPELGYNTFRLNFSSESIERIENGIMLLGELFKEAINKKTIDNK